MMFCSVSDLDGCCRFAIAYQGGKKKPTWYGDTHVGEVTHKMEKGRVCSIQAINRGMLMLILNDACGVPSFSDNH
jgi:hypothetical protein